MSIRSVHRVHSVYSHFNRKCFEKRKVLWSYFNELIVFMNPCNYRPVGHSVSFFQKDNSSKIN